MHPKRWLVLSMLFLMKQSFAQHADLGTGVLKNEIWWIDWAGVTITNGATRTFTTNDGLTVTVVFSHATTREPAPTVMTSNYFGSMLHLLYDFSDPSILPALYDGPQGTGVCTFTMTVSASRNGAPVAFYLVSADAEASWDGENSTLVTNGGAWQTMTLFRNSAQTSDPLTGCGTQTVSIQNTFDGNANEGQNPIVATLSPGTTPLTLDITLDHGATTGGMALAFGILQSEDRGDLPSSYGFAQHQLLYTFQNSCNYLPPLPSMTQDVSLMIGRVPGDADPIQYDNDDSIGVDEEGVSTFLPYDGSGSYTVNLTVGNTSGIDAWLTGWFDYNRDGFFQPSEAVTVVISNNATTASLTWTGLPTYLPQGIAAGYGFRFRLSSDKQATQQATGFARDGEVEDYFVSSSTLCTPLNPTASAGTPICPGQSAALQATGGVSYTWSPSTGLNDPAIASPLASPPDTTTYTVTAATPQGCSANASVTVDVKPPPPVTISGNSTICRGNSVQMQAAGGIAYTWTSSDPLFTSAGPLITTVPDSSTEYYVRVMGSNGCSATDSVGITVHQLPHFAVTPTDPAVCPHDTIRLSASGGDNYSWASADGTVLGSMSSLFVSPAVNTDYEVTITDDICQISGTLDIPVTVRPAPDLTITGTNSIDCTLGQATLAVTGALSYQWQPAPGLSNPGSADPVVNPLQTTTYYVKGTDANGCSSVDSITVKVNDAADPSHYPVPSAFTPNNDGHNDCFGLKYWGHITSLEMNVFNRWGQRVFSTGDPQQCWDGTFQGAPQPAGAYVYEIRATTTCGTAYRKGIVILVR